MNAGTAVTAVQSMIEKENCELGQTNLGNNVPAPVFLGRLIRTDSYFVWDQPSFKE
jgi:hypothetical protein